MVKNILLFLGKPKQVFEIDYDAILNNIQGGLIADIDELNKSDIGF